MYTEAKNCGRLCTVGDQNIYAGKLFLSCVSNIQLKALPLLSLICRYLGQIMQEEEIKHEHKVDSLIEIRGHHKMTGYVGGSGSMCRIIGVMHKIFHNKQFCWGDGREYLLLN